MRTRLFQSEWTRIQCEARDFEDRVQIRMRELRLDSLAEVEARRRIGIEEAVRMQMIEGPREGETPRAFHIRMAKAALERARALAHVGDAV